MDSRPNAASFTFADIRELLQPRASELRTLRAQYCRLMRGASNDEPSLGLELLPVARRLDRAGVSKYVFRTHDGLEVETVVVPMQHAQRHWKSVCVSSQIGCQRACRFCETASLGLLRSLRAGEIVAQVLRAQRDFGPVIRNVLFMGMGEPLDNLDAVIQAIRVLNDPSGTALKMARITVSTAGVPAGIVALGQLGWRRLNLAISLNAPNDVVRARLMPPARHASMAELRRALQDYPLRSNQHLMIEYVLIPGLNDAREHAQELAAYLAGLRSMVNVIPYNPRSGSPWQPPGEQQVRQFLDWLKETGQPCRRRVTRGRDEMAACGQLGNRALARHQPRPEPGGDSALPRI